MAKLIYSAITSLDGFVADENGNFDWAAPDEDVHAFVNDRERDVGTYLLGRRMYEVMSYWQSAPTDSGEQITDDYARIWQAADKIVFSRTLKEPSTPRTRIEHEFDPETIRTLVADAPQDVSIGGAELAAQALRAGLVDEVQLYLNSIVVGGGNPSLPADLRLGLELLDHQRFECGVVYLRYATTT